ncbi:DUF3953 domain-containing protein [Priestia endophytica]|uniref:DUF3953 domain-containing protein n=1 Tax=Priestia endophytica TaxID=135735 RepID=UPI00227EB450|nr:DUF3953 domain-containing protein [Priestia endophytica]MCY8233322.1 DUF3953 domain-containing protein [Priestia endophytica]
MKILRFMVAIIVICSALYTLFFNNSTSLSIMQVSLCILIFISGFIELQNKRKGYAIFMFLVGLFLIITTIYISYG